MAVNYETNLREIREQGIILTGGGRHIVRVTDASRDEAPQQTPGGQQQENGGGDT